MLKKLIRFLRAPKEPLYIHSFVIEKRNSLELFRGNKWFADFMASTRMTIRDLNIISSDNCVVAISNKPFQGYTGYFKYNNRTGYYDLYCKGIAGFKSVCFCDSSMETLFDRDFRKYTYYFRVWNN